jgi:serine/threonine protein kinase
LKQANVLVDSGGNARICDYGLAFILEPSEFASVKAVGACRWKAPEIMDPAESPQDAGASTSAPLFTQASDIYALGMTILEVCLSSLQ